MAKLRAQRDSLATAELTAGYQHTEAQPQTPPLHGT